MAKPNGVVLAIGGVVLLALGAAVVGRGASVAEADGTNLSLVFLTGLLTGGLTCLAVQGGLLATAVAARGRGQEAGTASLAGQAAPLALFLGAKLVAYTILGGLLGLFGSAIGLTPVARGWLQIAVGLFMLGVAGQLLDLHPLFRHFSLQPPKWLQRRIRRQTRRDGLLAPAALGALTVLIPCGTTQAMMVAAVGTGSPTRGALTMFAFVLGTTPLFFALGFLATRLGAALRGAFARVAAVVVLALAGFSIWAGLALVEAPISGGDGARADTGPVAPAAVSAPGAANQPASTVQEVAIRAEPRAYVPNRVRFKAGQPARLKVVTGEQRGCTSVFTIPSLGVEQALRRNSEATFDIPTDRPGRIKFTCGMGMYSGTIEVVR
ncbi:MAG: sulfite exporter TauE/SafE family protein [Chloroflexota bacterium]|nr:sulfite exporter TauE/SafE family protein [Chloroflexota bacterium]